MTRSSILIAACLVLLGCAASAVAPEMAAPRVETPASTEKPVTGRLPPELIQKIVRENFPNFRHCYEDGLRRDPTLAGRIAVRFVIERDGSVSRVGDGGSDMRDPEVTRCVLAAFAPLHFPQPEGGIVTVVYPIQFSSGEGQFREGDCVVEIKTQGEMLVTTRTCPGWAVMSTFMRTAEVDEAFATKNLDGFEQGAQGARSRPAIAGQNGWASVVAAGSGKPFRELFITRYNANFMFLASCQDEQATDASARCERAIEDMVGKAAKTLSHARRAPDRTFAVAALW